MNYSRVSRSDIVVSRAASTAALRLARLKYRRKLWLKVHLYLGLVLGPVFVVIGLTGSLIAFGQDIDEWLNADLMTVAVPQGGPTAYRPLDEIIATTRSVAPPGSAPVYLRFPHSSASVFSVIYQAPSSVSGEMDEYDIFVNPYTAQVLGQRVAKRADDIFASPLMALLIELHYNLLAGQVGTTFVGIVAVLLLFAVLTGLILWWPITGKWRQALTIKNRVSPQRFNYDLHRVTGFYSTLVLLVVLFSGVSMNFPERMTALVELFSPAPGWPEDIHSLPATGQLPLSITEAVTIANRVFSDGQIMGIALPDDEAGVYIVRKRAPDEVTKAYPHRQIWIDQYSGAILAINDPHQYTAGQKFLEWQYPLHSGEAFGLPGRILVLLSGLVCPVLYGTGIFLWWRRRRATTRHAKQMVKFAPKKT